VAQRINRQFRLRSHPQGRVKSADFDFVATPVAEPEPGQALIQVVYLSIDPTQRIWMSDREQYMPPVAIGEVMRGGAIGRVVASASERWSVGDLVRGQLGWQDFYLAIDGAPALLSRLPKDLPVPLPAMLGACGTTGITAYFGLLELGQPKPGETLVVSAAAGAVGSVVGQIAKIKGCRAVGIAGGPEKCRWLTADLCFDAAVDYKAPGWREALAAATPDSVDINFENVGGEVMAAVMARMKLGARMPLCGLISGYNVEGSAADDFTPILMKRLAIRGFIVTDFLPRWPEAGRELVGWVQDGRIKHRETIVDGLEQAPAALNRLFDGDNLGKLMVKVSEA
jgi:NADPH-dependent curcumin reductase CurA